MPDAPVSDDLYDVIVIGAGAAGLMAAMRSAERGKRTLLLEKNRKPGVKILMSGGTRCNITHDCDEAGIVAAFGSMGRFLHSPLASLGPGDLIALLHAEGLATKVELGGKIFPKSDRALDVLNALLGRFHRSGAELHLNEAVEGVGRVGDVFRIQAKTRSYLCTKLVVATGGKSYPGCGTKGDGYPWLTAMGHTIRRPRPALVPLTSDESWIHELSGVAASDVVLRVVNSASNSSVKEIRGRRGQRVETLIERRGSMLFTHFGLSGPVVLDVSRVITAFEQPADVNLVVDFVPDIGQEPLEELLRNTAMQDGRKPIAGFFAERLPRRLSEALFVKAGVPTDRRASELSKSKRTELVSRFKHCEIAITGSLGFDKAEVTAGGVELKEVDSRTMESKIVPNLYLVGEILDLDGFIGGYNFQAAFSTGWLAGESV